jgi:hypothetical protein
MLVFGVSTTAAAGSDKADRLNTDDPSFRGTALEYLEATLPSDVFHGIEKMVGSVVGRTHSGERDAVKLSAALKRSHGGILRRLNVVPRE